MKLDNLDPATINLIKNEIGKIEVKLIKEFKPSLNVQHNYDVIEYVSTVPVPVPVQDESKFSRFFVLFLILILIFFWKS